MNSVVYISTWGDDAKDGVLTFYYILGPFYNSRGIKIKGSFEESCVPRVRELVSDYE